MLKRRTFLSGVAALFTVPAVQAIAVTPTPIQPDYLSIFGELQDRGVPIPMRMVVRASGIDLQAVLDSDAADIQLRRDLRKFIDDAYQRQRGIL